MKRRTFLYGSLAVAGLMSGCCPIRLSPAPEWQSPLRRFPLKPNIQSKVLPLAFDVHTHLFNGLDVPVSGYLQGPVAHSANPLIRPVLEALGPFLERLAKRIAMTCADELAQLDEKLNSNALSALTDQAFQSDIDKKREQIISELINELPGSEFGKRLDEADSTYRNLLVDSTPLSRDPDRIRSAVLEGAEERHHGFASPTEEPSGVLTFVRYMLSPRHHNLIAFQRAYSSSDGSFGIDACFASLVDFDYWLDCCRTPSLLEDQVALHEKLAIISEGYVLPLVPYNPWTDIENDDESLKRVQDAILNRGFVGVKMYPPMGFSPLGNASFTTKLKRPDGNLLDEKLCALYAWCCEKCVPIMAHTAHSMGRDADHDGLSDPHSWAQVIREFPGLRINAGHFGGGYFDKATRRDWSREFTELMDDGAGRFVYADLGHEEELLKPGSDEGERTGVLLGQKLTGTTSAKVYERVMYGSDWLMLSKLKGWENYPFGINAYLEGLGGEKEPNLSNAIFYENAVTLFGLAKGGANRERLEKFYKKWGVSTPEWMLKLDNIIVSA